MLTAAATKQGGYLSAFVRLCAGNDCVSFTLFTCRYEEALTKAGVNLLQVKKTLVHPLIFEFFPYLCRPKK